MPPPPSSWLSFLLFWPPKMAWSLATVMSYAGHRQTQVPASTSTSSIFTSTSALCGLFLYRVGVATGCGATSASPADAALSLRCNLSFGDPGCLRDCRQRIRRLSPAEPPRCLELFCVCCYPICLYFH